MSEEDKRKEREETPEDVAAKIRRPDGTWDFLYWRNHSQGISQPKDEQAKPVDPNVQIANSLKTILDADLSAWQGKAAAAASNLLSPSEMLGNFAVSGLEMSLAGVPLDVRAGDNIYLKLQQVKVPEQLAAMHKESRKVLDAFLAGRGLQKSSESSFYVREGYVLLSDGAGLDVEAAVSGLIFDEILASDSGSKAEERFMSILIHDKARSRAICQLVKREDDAYDDKVVRLDVIYYNSGSVKHVPVYERKK